MPMKIEELNEMLNKYNSAISGLKIELCRYMKRVLWTMEDMTNFVSGYLNENSLTDYGSNKYLIDSFRPFATGEHSGHTFWDKGAGCDLYEDFLSFAKEKNTKYVIETSLTDIVEVIQMPLTVGYGIYRLRPDAHKVAFGLPAMELYRKQPENFKTYFELAGEKEKRTIIESIFKHETSDTRNKELEEWLSRGYRELVEKCGRNLVPEDRTDKG